MEPKDFNFLIQNPYTKEYWSNKLGECWTKNVEEALSFDDQSEAENYCMMRDELVLGMKRLDIVKISPQRKIPISTVAFTYKYIYSE